MTFAGRSFMEPHGYVDEIAEKKLEKSCTLLNYLEPRDSAGTMVYLKVYLDPNTPDLNMVYIPSMRRIRRMSTSDTQDPIMGSDAIYDDLNYKISKIRFPFEYDVLEEREYLVPSFTLDSSEYLTKGNVELRGVPALKFERRPVIVLEMKQTDPSYIYSKRHLFIDAELFVEHGAANFDQKGRLYRSMCKYRQWYPEMGMVCWGPGTVLRDHIELHSTINRSYQLPAYWNRVNLSIEGKLGLK